MMSHVKFISRKRKKSNKYKKDIKKDILIEETEMITMDKRNKIWATYIKKEKEVEIEIVT